MKHLLTLTLLCFGLLAQAQIPSYVPTNGLVGWWPFNGNANDESGNGNHGTVNGATLAADRFGNTGKAYSFDGVDDWIRLTSVNGLSSNNGLSMSIWLKWIGVNGIDNHQYIFQIAPNPNGSITITDMGNLGANVLNCNCSSDLGIDSIISSNQWYHTVLTYDLFTGAMRMYINGRLIKSTNENLFSYYTVNNNESRIGSYHFGSHFFKGFTDEAVLYNRTLSAAEVQQLYSGCQTKPTFTFQPQNKSVAQGQTTTFAVQVDSASSFQWQMNLGLGAGWTNIPSSALFSGDTTATLSVQGRNPLDGAQFRCIATSCNSDTSNAATLTVTSSATAAAGIVAGVPGLINYQGSALDSAGKPMKNQTISLKLSVLDSSSTGAAVYVETHSATTNVSGHFAIQIGGGTALLSTFDSVGWSNGRNKYLKTELSQNGTWVNLGTSQLVSVPYALHAGNATNASYANFFKDSLGNAYQIKTVNGQPTLVAAPGSASNPSTFACGQSVTYAGESYPTVQIGTQCWFQKNLNVGTMILGANDQTNNSILEKYCYNNDTANCAIYGGLYQWAEAVQYQNGASNTASPSPAFSGNVKGMCPTGWHVPSDGEFCTLTSFMDASVNCFVNSGWSGLDVGGKMKSTSGLWVSPNFGATDSSGFSGLPAGERINSSTFGGLGNGAKFWYTSEFSNTYGNHLGLSHGLSSINYNSYLKSSGYSVRCLKD